MDFKILTVDDDVTVIETIEKMFTTMLDGFKTENAMSANAGMSKIRQERPDVIIVDVRLGEKSGMDLVADFHDKAKQQQYQPVFIVITAFDDEGPKKLADKYKVAAFIKKPFKQERLLHEVLDAVSMVMHNKLRYIDQMKAMYARKLEQLGDADKDIQKDQ